MPGKGRCTKADCRYVWGWTLGVSTEAPAARCPNDGSPLARTTLEPTTWATRDQLGLPPLEPA